MGEPQESAGASIRRYGFFHASDLDGHCSGAVLLHRFPDIVLKPFNYGWIFPWDELHLEPQDEVYMADISVPVEDMARIASKCRFIWLDHHASPIRAVADAIEDGIIEETDIDGIQVTDKAGCELVWRFLYPDKKLPRFIDLIAKWDVWDHREEDVAFFQYWMRSQEDTFPQNKLWKDLFAGKIKPHKVRDKGRAIKQYVEADQLKAARSMAFEIQLEGLTVLTINKGGGSKLLEPIYDPIRHDAMMTFYRHKHGNWHHAIFSSKEGIDVSRVVVRMRETRDEVISGGGHKGASGFITTQPLPEILNG